MIQVLGAAMDLGNTPAGRIINYLQGHLYRCPNGHVYLIGECGGAMAPGRCVECGATIGGAHHQLQADNSSATDIVHRMERAINFN